MKGEKKGGKKIYIFTIFILILLRQETRETFFGSCCFIMQSFGGKEGETVSVWERKIFVFLAGLFCHIACG